MNLPETYAAVCAKRPELAVKWLSTTTNKWAYDHPPITVFVFGITSTSRRLMMDYHAAALILARWVEALPDGHDLSHNCFGWEVCRLDLGGDCIRIKEYPTPLEALAAFYLEYAK